MASVLIVDDNSAFRTALKTTLKRSGHQVVEAGNGTEAIQLLTRHSVDIVVTDILMPSCDGIELIRHVRQANRTLPILAMSGGGRAGGYDTLAPALKLGANAAIAKPFRMAEFVAQVDGLLTKQDVTITDRG
jgi:CheY-like chemotaxis protein